MKPTVAELLLAWYDSNKRSMPWRDIHHPYATWVSETMLQQTRVETVLRYYPAFLERFPDIESLADAPLDEVLKQWEGLGYYRRARNLHAGARQVVDEYGGVLPQSPDELKRIRGIGAYTAGAIASIAYQQPVPAIDGNATRVISRLAGIRENAAAPSTQREIARCACELLDPERPGDFNQALMDLGARICVPGTPDCEHCPLQALCDAYEAGDEADLPLLPHRTPPKLLHYDVCLICNGNRVLMRQRTETMLQGLWVFPMLEGCNDQDGLATQVRRALHLTVTSPCSLGEAKHVFTHQIWQMRLFSMRCGDAQPPKGYRYCTPDELEALPKPVAMRAATGCAMELLRR